MLAESMMLRYACSMMPFFWNISVVRLHGVRPGCIFVGGRMKCTGVLVSGRLCQREPECHDPILVKVAVP